MVVYAAVSSAGAVSPMSSSAATGISITTSPSSDTIVDDSWRKREVDGMVDIVPSGPGQGSEYFLRSCLSRRSLSSRTWAPFFCRFMVAAGCMELSGPLRPRYLRDDETPGLYAWRGLRAADTRHRGGRPAR